MYITLSNAGEKKVVQVPDGSHAGFVRGLTDELEDIAAPSSFTLAVNGRGVDDSHGLSDGDEVSFRPRSGEKG